MSTLDNAVLFKEMCEKHDLTYTYSDDGKVYDAGKAQYAEIIEMSKTLPRWMAVQIWNEVVERKLIEYAWPEYKWSE